MGEGVQHIGGAKGLLTFVETTASGPEQRQ